MDKVLELFAPPVGLHPIPVFGNMKLYTSESLRKKYLKAMSKTEKLKPVIGHVSKLVNDNIIIPAFMTKGIVRTLFYRMFPIDRARTADQYFRKEFKNVYGFYDSGSKKIYLLISNNINIFGMSSNKLLANLTVHESAHMYAANKPGKFISKFRSDLFDYYNYYFTELLDLRGNYSKELLTIVELLFNRFEKSKDISNKDLVRYHTLLMKFKPFSQLHDDEFDRKIRDYIVAVKLFVKSTSAFIRNMNRYMEILLPLEHAYKKTFGGNDAGNLVIQELLFPSEVIAVASEIGNGSSIVRKIFS